MRDARIVKVTSSGSSWGRAAAFAAIVLVAGACQLVLELDRSPERERVVYLPADAGPTDASSSPPTDASRPLSDAALLDLHCASPRAGTIYCADFEKDGLRTYGLPEDAGYSIVPGGLDGALQLQIDVYPAVTAALVDLSSLEPAPTKVTISADVTCVAKNAIFTEYNDVTTGVVGLIGPAPTSEPMVLCMRPKGIGTKLQLRVVLVSGAEVGLAPSIVLVDDVPDGGVVQRVEFSVEEQAGTLTVSARGETRSATGTLRALRLAVRTFAQQPVFAFVDNLTMTSD